MSQQATVDLHARLLRAWHLALLRFALTRENADRLGILAIANEIDRLGGPHDAERGFNFFRRTSAELCAAMLLRQDSDDAVLKRYLEQIDDTRLHQTMAAALGLPPRKSPARKRVRSPPDLWKGLPSRASSQS
jgi:hypothetical protein